MFWSILGFLQSPFAEGPYKKSGTEQSDKSWSSKNTESKLPRGKLNPQPSNVSGMDGRKSTISKHVPEGNILLLGQTHYYAPEETSCLFRWADPLTTVTYSPGPVERLLSPRGFSLPPSHTVCINLITLCDRYYSAISSVHLRQFYPHGHIP